MRFLSARTPYGFWLLCLLFLLACKKKQEQLVEQQKEGHYRVIAIKDGDTIELLKDGKPLRVRLQGVDCPEKTQAFGERARQFTSDQAFGKFVQLKVSDIDRYGRTVGEIILPDGRNLNYELVKYGFAWHYTAYSKDQELARLEQEARAHKWGLWADPSPQAPWDFRKQRKSNSASPAKASTQAKRASTGGATITNKNTPVYLCQSKAATTYHIRTNCYRLQTCKKGIETVTLAQAKRQGRTPCSVCAQ
ncbi:thermonuclease family protein [Rufibacter soli]